MLTQAILKELYYYDKYNGIFTRIKRCGKLLPNSKVGCQNLKDSYLRLKINKKYYLLHRLAWMYVHGQFPIKFIDHIDGNKLNNSIENLRLVTKSENAQNIKKPHKDNKTGYLGVYLHLSGLYGSRICLNGKSKSLGYYKIPYDAHVAYLKAKRIMHPMSTI